MKDLIRETAEGELKQLRQALERGNEFAVAEGHEVLEADGAILNGQISLFQIPDRAEGNLSFGTFQNLSLGWMSYPTRVFLIPPKKS